MFHETLFSEKINLSERFFDVLTQKIRFAYLIRIKARCV